MEKDIAQQIAETRALIQQIIVNSGLNVSILELLIGNIHNEIKLLANQNLQMAMEKYNEKEDTDGNTNETGKPS